MESNVKAGKIQGPLMFSEVTLILIRSELLERNERLRELNELVIDSTTLILWGPHIK